MARETQGNRTTSLMVSVEDFEYAASIGDGMFSRGVRRALEAHRQRAREATDAATGAEPVDFERWLDDHSVPYALTQSGDDWRWDICASVRDTGRLPSPLDRIAPHEITAAEVQRPCDYEIRPRYVASLDAPEQVPVPAVLARLEAWLDEADAAQRGATGSGLSASSPLYQQIVSSLIGVHTDCVIDAAVLTAARGRSSRVPTSQLKHLLEYSRRLLAPGAASLSAWRTGDWPEVRDRARQERDAHMQLVTAQVMAALAEYRAAEDRMRAIEKEDPPDYDGPDTITFD